MAEWVSGGEESLNEPFSQEEVTHSENHPRGNLTLRDRLKTGFRALYLGRVYIPSPIGRNWVRDVGRTSGQSMDGTPQRPRSTCDDTVQLSLKEEQTGCLIATSEWKNVMFMSVP